jgi:hypothetical protein
MKIRNNENQEWKNDNSKRNGDNNIIPIVSRESKVYGEIKIVFSRRPTQRHDNSLKKLLDLKLKHETRTK